MRTWQQTLRSGLLAVEAAVVAVLLLLRFAGMRLPFHGIFLTIVVLAVTPTLLWWAWLDQRLAAFGRRSRRWLWLRLAVAAYGAAMLSPLFMVRLHGHDALPVPLLIWVMLWHLLLIVLGLIVLGVWTVRLVLRGGRAAADGLAGRHNTDDPPADCNAAGANTIESADPPCQPAAVAGLSRRSFMATTLASAPVAIVGGTAVRAVGQQGQFRVRRIQMRLPRLPTRCAA